jgi:hypothetical protein
LLSASSLVAADKERPHNQLSVAAKFWLLLTRKQSCPNNKNKCENSQFDLVKQATLPVAEIGSPWNQSLAGIFKDASNYFCWLLRNKHSVTIRLRAASPGFKLGPGLLQQRLVHLLWTVVYNLQTSFQWLFLFYDQFPCIREK